MSKKYPGEPLSVIPRNTDKECLLWYDDSHMTLKTFICTAATALALVSFAGFAHAQETVADPIPATVILDASTTDATTATTTATVSDQPLSDADELASLKLREEDPNTGGFMKFLLRFKIRQLENQLNVKNALQ